jgi:hypothetical protein
MKLLRKLKAFVLLFALLALVIGFTVLNTPDTAQASGDCCYWVCTIEGPPVCWHVCRPCPPFP